MKILYTNAHPRNGGGHATYITNLARSLGHEHEVHIATPETSRLYAQASQMPGVRCIPATFSTRFFTMLAETKRLHRLLCAERYDVVHVNGSADHRQAILACAAMRQAPKIVWTKHNTMAVASFGHTLRAALGTAGAIGVCDKVSDLLKQSTYAKKPIKTIRLGVDLDAFSPLETTQKIQARQRFLGDLPEETLVLGSVGGTDIDKGWPIIMRAIAGLPKAQQARVRMIVAGDPPKAAMQAEIEQLGLQQIMVFPGLIKDPVSVLAASDIGFVFSFHEAGSYAACESLAMGLPTLVSNAGGLPELVRDGVDGWILPAGDVQAVQHWLLTLLSEGYPLSMQKAARERAQNLFSMDLLGQSTLDFYTQVSAQ